MRVPANNPQTILSYLETGALTVQIPHVNTAEEAHLAVQAVKYPPLGIRGAGSSRAADYGLRLGSADYFAAANQQTLAIPMVEEIQGVENVDEIVKVEGLQALFIGVGANLALSMGLPCEAQPPRRARRHRKSPRRGEEGRDPRRWRWRRHGGQQRPARAGVRVHAEQQPRDGGGELQAVSEGHRPLDTSGPRSR